METDISGPHIIIVRLRFELDVAPDAPSFFALLGPAARAWSKMLHRWIVAALEADSVALREDDAAILGLSDLPGILVVRDGFWIFSVTDWRRGLSIIRAELQTLELLPFAQIIYGDKNEGVYRNYHPPGGVAFDPNALLEELTRGKKP